MLESPANRTSTPRYADLLLAVFAVGVLFAFLGSPGLVEPDEGRYAEIGREMAESGDWLIPRLDGFAHLQKPPVIYWATAASFKVFGLNEWAARLPSALAALGVVWLTLRMGRTLFGRVAGLTAALVLLSSVEFFQLARTLTPDMLLTFWTTAAVACLVQFVQGGRRALWRWGFFIAMGLGFLTKGPMALVVPVAAAVCWQWSLRRAGEKIRLGWFSGMIATLALGLSWFVAVCVQHPALFGYFTGEELVKRFGSGAHGRAQPFWFFVPVLVVGLTPWIFFLPAAARTVWRRWRAGQSFSPAHWLLAGWAGVPFIILSASGSKLLTYVLPLFPALALALGVWWQNHPATRAAQTSLKVALGFFLVLPGALLLLPGFFPELGLPFSATFFVTLGVVGGLALLSVCFTRRGPASVPLALAGAAVVFWLGITAQFEKVNPLLRRQASIRPLARQLQSLGAARVPVFAYEVRAHGLEFYLRRLVNLSETEADLILPPDAQQQSRLLRSVEDCGRLGAAGAPVYGLILTARFKEFPSAEWQTLGRVGDFSLIGRKPAVP